MALAHSEFVEPLIRLHEDKLGLQEADRDFGLPWWNGQKANEEEEEEEEEQELVVGEPSPTRSWRSRDTSSRHSFGTGASPSSAPSTSMKGKKDDDKIDELSCLGSYVDSGCCKPLDCLPTNEETSLSHSKLS